MVGALFVVFLHGQAAPSVDAVTPRLRGEVFDRAAARALWYAVAAFAVAFLVSFALPPGVRREEPQPAAVPA